jgi:sugar phosphate isomerase/epimerase
MLRAMSTYTFVHERLNPSHLDALRRGGAQAVEIFCARGHFDYTSKSHIKEIAAWLQTNGIELNSLHSPMYSDVDWGKRSSSVNIVDPDKRLRIDATDEIKRALEVAETLPFRFLVQHIGSSGEHFSDRKFDDAMTAIEHLRAFAKPLGVTVLVENIPNELSEPQKLAELLRISHFGDVGICFDFGHAHLMNTVARDFETLEPHIRSTHVHDNSRDRDAHLWPGKGNIDWDEAMTLLRNARHVPPLLFEIEGEEGADIGARAAESFKRLEAAKQPQ